MQNNPTIQPSPPAPQWRPVVGWEGKYEVSDLGGIRKCTGEPVGQWAKHDGYIVARLSQPRKQVRVHRLVAEAFVANPFGYPSVNHIDHNPANNAAANLEWCTQAMNLDHASRAGRMQRDHWVGKRSPSAALSDETADEIRTAYAAGGVSWSALATKYGSNKRTVGRIIRRETYV